MLQDRLGKDLLIFDGAMGTQLQEKGLKAGEIPEMLNITHPKWLQDIHEAYLRAGADFITTNTFGANRLKMKEASASLKEIIEAAIHNAKEAKKNVGKEAYIALDIGPIGSLMEPMGTLTFDEAYDIVKEQILLAKDEVDLILFETMSDLYEVKAGVLAAKENCDLPVFVTMTFEANGRTLSGSTPTTMVNVCSGLGVDAIGVNCSLGPDELKPIIEEILSVSHLPVMIQPNAGLPCLIDGHTHFDITREHYCESVLTYAQSGVSIIGGCCGTTPAFIELLKETLPKQASPRVLPKKTLISSGTDTIELGKSITVCGERLNPTGKKKLKQALLDQQYERVVLEAINQERAGAHVLDVNVGVPGIDEPLTMRNVIKMVQEVVTLPLQIDSSNIDALETGCRYYNGRPLVNSVNGKSESMDCIFPIVKKYGGIIIGLTLDDQGIPDRAEERFEIAEKIIAKAKEYGIYEESIVIDCLVLTASAKQAEVMETIKAVQMVKTLGVHTVLGVSNVSFGLPDRPLLNRTYLTMAMTAGLDLPIMNPMDQEMMAVIDAFNVLHHNDVDAVQYIERHVQTKKKLISSNTSFTLKEIVMRGIKDEVVQATRTQLKEKTAMEIINTILIPALEEVGNGFEKGTVFLPQLIQSAETTKMAFEILKETFKNDAETLKGPIVLATVEGDIHDIGKNIVKVVLESYGFQVIDLGRDVKVEKVVEAYHQYQPKLIGLSALMITTVVSMEKTIALLKQIDHVCPIMVGGAVLTPEYAMQIHADYYAKDALQSVEIAQKVIG
ncbi:MAG: homocysteine S-methyltransferase family protein [Beduini sp.]|uniref:homocysteine S-methyltransferase family protein n=1 Tax=Beduini sp. TaxID=1922300 RepID=UPI0039A26C3C